MRCNIILLTFALLTVAIHCNSANATSLPLSQLVAEPRALELRLPPDADPIIELRPGKVAFNNSRWDYLFDYWQLGTTWYDCQNIGSAGKRIAWGDG